MHISEHQFMQLCGNPEPQADGSSDEKNADLTLVITRELVNMHGGNLYFDTHSHAGTRFSFTLPLEQAKATTPFINPNMNMIKRLCARGLSTLNLDTEPDLDMSDSHNAARRFRILVVDDEEVNRRVLRNHLASQHYNVVEAGSGSDALAIIAREEPLDLIVLDLIMPNMSGLELCQNIRQRHSRQDLPIILVTNKFNIDDVMASFSAGGNDLLSKPVSRQELLARVDLHLQLLVSRRDLEEKVHERTIDLEAAYKKLEELTLSDPLTGLGNRRLLEKVIAGDTSEAMRIYNNRLRNSNYTIGNESDMVFFLLDIDFFKKINDTYGHLAGDKVLINVANILKDVCRKSDYAIRWGGEEFLFIARYTHRENAQIIAERLLQRISSSLFDIGNGKSLSITCSIGFCTFPPVPSVPDALTWDETINIADACLYAAKKTQRNAWVGINKAEMDFTLADLMHNNPEKGFELKTSIPSKHLILWE